MANLKIIWTTGRPFSPASIDKIGYQISSGEFNIYSGSYWANQSSSMGRGYRPATAEEIAEHWNVLHSRWTPEPGDRVIITQNIGNWCNTRGTIVGDGGDDYWVVRRDDDGHTCNFKREDQMILAPYEETAKPVETPKPTIFIPKEGYITVRLFTEEEFKYKDRWDTYGGKGHPTGWNSDGDMNKYLGTYLQIPNSDFRGHSFKYKGWEFRSTDYEVIHESVEPKVETKVEAKVEPKEPEMKPQRFKVGDRVTYKSRSECYGGGYHYGGNNQYGYVGTIKEYLKYKPDNNCYKITVTCKEGEYSMLESEFYEYDDLGLGIKIHKSTSENIGIGTSSGTDFRVTSSGTANAIFLPLDTWGIHFHKTSSELKEEDPLAKYDQAPVTLRKKPKRKLIIENTY
jgi:hypothetical protein